MDLMHFSHSRMNQDGLVGTHGIWFQDGDTRAHRLCERKRRRGPGRGGLSLSLRGQSCCYMRQQQSHRVNGDPSPEHLG